MTPSYSYLEGLLNQDRHVSRKYIYLYVKKRISHDILAIVCMFVFIHSTFAHDYYTY